MNHGKFGAYTDQGPKLKWRIKNVQSTDNRFYNTRWPKDGETIINGHTLFHPGRKYKYGTAFIGFIVSPEARKLIINFTPINEMISV